MFATIDKKAIICYHSIMNSFQVEQRSGKTVKSGRFLRTFTRLSLLSTTLIVAVLIVLINGASLTSFAQNLPKPQQVLGISSQNTFCEGAPYQKPSAIALGAFGPGLQFSQAEPQFYSIYGANVDALRRSLTNCEVRKQSGGYHALTTYTLNWQYDTEASAGQCTLQNVKIGLATNQFLPRLAENQSLSAKDRASWDVYYANLISHEEEHLALNKKYAADLYAALTIISAPCSSIEAHANTATSTYVQLLNSANELLDSKTNHGADTGAVL